MPTPDEKVLARRAEIAAALSAIVPGEGVIDHPDGLRPYETDGLTAYRQSPMLVVLPETTAQVAAVIRWCHEHEVRIVPRGAGTSLSGGALPLADGVVLGLSKLNRIVEIDYLDRVVVAQPGVTNLAVTQAVESEGFYYAPDPSSQIACTIGGNVAENAGGVHCLKYGVTTNNVLGVEFVTATGDIVRLGGRGLEPPGLDLLGVVVGSEGDRSHGANPAAARMCQGPFDRIRRRGERWTMRGRDHRIGHHPGRHGNDGSTGDSRR
jgi:glycolate oxidase